MILEEIEGLIGHFRAEAKCNVSFGLRDLTPDDYPHLSVIPAGDVAVPTKQDRLNTLTMALQLRVTVSRTNERDALTVFERVVKAANGYHQSKGHTMAETGTAEYGDNTFSISLPFIIKSIV